MGWQPQDSLTLGLMTQEETATPHNLGRWGYSVVNRVPKDAFLQTSVILVTPKMYIT